MKPVEASYENGILKPAKPLPLAEGEHVRLIVFRKPDPGRWNLDKLADTSKQDEDLTRAGLASWADALDAEDSGRDGENSGGPNLVSIDRSSKPVAVRSWFGRASR